MNTNNARLGHSIVAVFTLASVTAFACAQDCETIVPGGLVVGEHWTLEGSPYCVTGDIDLIGVVIDPGVEVWVDGDFSIEFVGNVTAAGTEDQPILFTEKDEDDNWNGIFMNNAFPPIVLQHCTIEYSDSGGLRIDNSSDLIVEDCILRNNSRGGQGGGLYIDNSTSSFDVILKRCVFENNSATTQGGGVYASMSDGHLTLNICVFENNSSTGSDGGGLYASLSDGNLTFNDCMIVSNSAGGHGGGLSASLSNGQLTLNDCIVESNSTASGHGGGVDAVESGGDVEVNTCMIKSNSAAGHGGGVRAIMGDGELRLEDCIISDNYANSNHTIGNYNGGGLNITGSSILTGCTIQNNIVLGIQNCIHCDVYSKGGGVWIDGDATIGNSNIRDNTSRAEQHHYLAQRAPYSLGGGLYVHNGSVSLINNVVSCNSCTAWTASDYTGLVRRGAGTYVGNGSMSITNSALVRNDKEGIYHAGGSVTVINSIVYFNYDGGIQIYPDSLTVTYTDVQGGYDGEGNINYHPGFYGDECSCPDFRIILYSPCVDAGKDDPAYDDGCLPPGLGTERNDMGAHGGPLNCGWPCWEPADINCDQTVNTADLLILLGSWGECDDCDDCPADLNCDCIVNTEDLLTLLSRWGS